MINQLIFLLIIISTCSAYVNIDNIGAIRDIDTVKTAEFNSKVIEDSFMLAHKMKDKVVYVPDGIYYISAINISDFNDMSFVINGTLIAHDRIEEWPIEDDDRQTIFQFTNMNNFKMIGNGTIDGQGYRWWWAAILSATGRTVDDRPNMIHIVESYDFELSGITMKNSPRFHLRLIDVINVHIHHFIIDVDITNQKQLLSRLPTFPLNTDGIDPSAVNVHIHDFYIKNYDDAIAVKSCNKGFKYCMCSTDMLIEDGYVYNSVGLSVGSVPPNDNTNCINNITFRNVYLEYPFKGIYVKTNRGNHGNGSISNINYTNITIDKPIWWPIYIGPQQQSQPDGKGEGCMKYPLEDCPTEPRITMSNISLTNVSVINSVNPYPGLLRCNDTNPCYGFKFNNVTASTIPKMRDYICENVDMESMNSYPIPCVN